MASSPAAAAATHRNRAATANAESDEDVEKLGRQAILDQEEQIENQRGFLEEVGITRKIQLRNDQDLIASA